MIQTDKGYYIGIPGIFPPVVLPHIIDAAEETISENTSFHGGLELLNGAIVTVSENTEVKVYDHLTLSGGAVLVNNGDFTAESITVTGTGNIISGKLIDVNHLFNYHILYGAYVKEPEDSQWYPIISLNGVFVEEGADLTVSKDQFDRFMKQSYLYSEGTLYVQKSTGNALRQMDVQKIISAGSIRDIDFQQELIDISDLTFTAGSNLTFRCEDAYGTSKNDLFRFEKNTNITFGGEGRVIDFFEGKNKVQADSGSHVSILSDLINVSSIQIADGTILSKTEFSAGNAAFSDERADSLTVGNYTDVIIGNLTGGMFKDQIIIGKNTSFRSGNINEFDTISIGAASTWTAGNIVGDGPFTIKTGADSVCSVGDISIGYESMLFSGEYPWHYIFYIGETNDAVRIGKRADFQANSMDLGAGKNVLSADIGSKVTVSGEITGIHKLQISGEFTAGDVSGTDFSDKFTFGNFSKVNVKNIVLDDVYSDKSDQIKIGNHANVNVSSLIKFNSGKNQLIIGKNAEVVLKTSSADSLTRFTVGKGTVAFLSSELMECEKLKNNGAVLFDIGAAQNGIAQNFTDLSQEQTDNDFDSAGELAPGTEYNGWLCGENALDLADYFQRGIAAEIQCGEKSDALSVCQWGSDGRLLKQDQFGGTIALTKSTVAFSVMLEELEHSADKALSYQITLV